jgi:hypothetical protein
MVSAYLLIKIQGGTKTEGMEHVTSHPQVKKMTWVLGPYDVIIECELNSMEELGAFARVVRACPGVAESVTCLAVE